MDQNPEFYNQTSVYERLGRTSHQPPANDWGEDFPPSGRTFVPSSGRERRHAHKHATGSDYDHRRRNWKAIGTRDTDDDTSSSSDDDEFNEWESWEYTGQKVDSIVAAIRADFLRKIPNQNTNRSEAFQRQGLAFRQLSAMNRPKAAIPQDEEEHIYVTIDSEPPSAADRPGAPVTLSPNPTYLDLPRNALVSFYGSVTLTPKELQKWNLDRGMRALYCRPDRCFAILKIRRERLTLEECDSAGEGDADSTDTSDDEERFNPHHFGRSGIPQSGGSKDTKKPLGKRLFSCMKGGLPGYRGLDYNSSLSKASTGKRAMSCYEFDYNQIVYCESSVRGAPETLLFWIYYMFVEERPLIELYAIDCDDQKHAGLLVQSLEREIQAHSRAKR